MFGTLTILVIILAVIITAQNVTKKSETKTDIMLNPSSTPTPTSTPTPSLSPTDKPTLTPTPTPTTFIATPQPNNDNQSVLDFKYPNSTTISQNEKEATFESTDGSKKITDWYKDKIKSIGMKATSYVQTSTNGNILNKLVGSNGNKEVRVEITKQNSNPIVKIVVTSN